MGGRAHDAIIDAVELQFIKNRETTTTTAAAAAKRARRWFRRESGSMNPPPPLVFCTCFSSLLRER